jgi:drug/metabolite transporter (DMT)-like permease
MLDQADITPAAVSVPQNGVVRGMVLMSIAMLLLPVMDALAKLLSTSYGVSPGQITFGRFFVQAGLLLVIIPVFFQARLLIPNRVWGNLARGALISLASLLFFVAIRYMPIADAMAVFFIEPFFLTVLSVLILKEQVGWRRRMAIVIGFIGALLIIQPSYALFGPVSLLPILTAFLFAFYLLFTRQLSAHDEPITMQFVAGVGGALTLIVVMTLGNLFDLENFSAPSVPEFGIRWLLIFLIGALAAGGHLMVVFAFRLASASILAPFQYLEIVSATTLGFLMFNDFPDALKWLGIAIIVGSGVYLFVRERVVANGNTNG